MSDATALPRDAAVALLARAPVVRLASTDPDGAPVLRALHAVVHDDAVWFHASPTGEKTRTIGRPTVIAAEEIVASIPSWFLDPERACPATTWYESVIARGVTEAVHDPATKAAVLAALMRKYQPEGRYRPIDPDLPMYRRAVANLLVARLPLDRLEGRRKLGGHKPPAVRARVLEQLWARGTADDVRAIDRIRDACPDTPTPAFLAAPDVVRLRVAPGEAHAAGIPALVGPTYWNAGMSDDELVRAHLGATAWIVALHGDRLVATARAVADGAKWAWIYDVVVDPDWRGRGVGDAVMRTLLDHPAVRGVRGVWLATKDAMGFYARLGFVERASLPPKPYASVEMALFRRPPAGLPPRI